jgi:hypothetical protein
MYIQLFSFLNKKLNPEDRKKYFKIKDYKYLFLLQNILLIFILEFKNITKLCITYHVFYF